VQEGRWALIGVLAGSRGLWPAPAGVEDGEGGRPGPVGAACVA